MNLSRALDYKGTEFIFSKDQNLLASLDTKTNPPFHGMIARTKSNVFTEIFLAVFPLEPPFLACTVNVLHIWFSK